METLSDRTLPYISHKIASFIESLIKISDPRFLKEVRDLWFEDILQINYQK